MYIRTRPRDGQQSIETVITESDYDVLTDDDRWVTRIRYENDLGG